jgi:hypothetical protein
MSNPNRHIELLRQSHDDLMVQYNELLCLRAKVASLVFPLRRVPARKPRIASCNRSAARAPQRNGRPASSPPILLLVPEHYPA